MNYLQGLQNAIEYAEAHIADEIDFAEVSKCAGMSISSFRRFFLLIADMSFSEYIRKRRMLHAIDDLCDTNEKIIDIALKYGYDSAAAFTRALKLLTGCTPSQIRKNDCDFHFPKFSPEIQVRAGELLVNHTPIVKIEEHHREKVIVFRTDCESPENAAWELMSKWCKEHISDRTARRYVGFAPCGHHPNGVPHLNAFESDAHPYEAMMFLIGDECELSSFHGMNVENAPNGLFLVNEVVLNQYDEDGNLDIAFSMMKASESFVEFMVKTDRYEFDCGSGLFYEEHIFDEQWFDQGGFADSFKMWVPIVKKHD